MSLTNAATSTFSTLINNIIIVVNDNNSYNSGGSTISTISTPITRGYTNIIGTNSTTSPPPQITNCFKTNLASQSVTHLVPQVKVITVVTMLIFFSVFGCLGNGLVLYVFSKKSDKVTSTIFILALAWTDFFTCLIFMPFTAVYIQLNSRLHLDFFCKLYQFLNTCNVPLSAFIMVAIAVDRYFSICHPFVHVVTPRRARGAIISLVLVAFTLGSITACIYDAHKSGNSTDAIGNSTDVITFGHHNTHNNQTANVSLLDKTDYLAGNTTPTPVNRYMTDLSKIITEANMEVITNNTKLMSVGYSTQEHKSDECPDENVEGLCVMNEKILSYKFTEMYQKIYISFYVVSLLAVFSLYFLIYRSVAERRAWRRKQKSWSHSPMTMTGAVTIDAENGNKFNDVYVGDGENLELSPQNTDLNHQDNDNDVGDNNSKNIVLTSTSRKVMATGTVKPICPHENGLDSCQLTSSAADKKTNRERRDFNFLANIRTAIMLFVVTLVFILSFLPAWLMATQLMTFEIIVFYMHFVYNMANPIIYAFMNQSFRKEIRRVFQRGTQILRGG